MSARSARHAARTASDRAERTRALADLMREHRHGAEDGLTTAMAQAAGFTLAEIEVYRDAAAALARSESPVTVPPAPLRAAGQDLVRQAQARRRRSVGA